MASASDAQTASERRLCGGALRLLAGHTEKVSALAWSFEVAAAGGAGAGGGGGATLASASDDGSVRLWRGLTASLAPGDIPAGPHAPSAGAGAGFGAGSGGRLACAVLRGHGAPVDALAWCPAAGARHRLASAGGDGSLRLWDTRDGSCEALLAAPGLGEAEHLAWRGPDGGALAVATRADELLLVDVRGGRPVLTGRVRMALQLNEVAWAPSGLLFAVAVRRRAARRGPAARPARGRRRLHGDARAAGAGAHHGSQRHCL